MAAFGRFCLGFILCMAMFFGLQFSFQGLGYPAEAGSASYWFGFIAAFLAGIIWDVVDP